jgi:hypothetical protein
LAIVEFDLPLHTVFSFRLHRLRLHAFGKESAIVSTVEPERSEALQIGTSHHCGIIFRMS